MCPEILDFLRIQRQHSVPATLPSFSSTSSCSMFSNHLKMAAATKEEVSVLTSPVVVSNSVSVAGNSPLELMYRRAQQQLRSQSHQHHQQQHRSFDLAAELYAAACRSHQNQKQHNQHHQSVTQSTVTNQNGQMSLSNVNSMTTKQTTTTRAAAVVIDSTKSKAANFEEDLDVDDGMVEESSSEEEEIMMEFEEDNTSEGTSEDHTEDEEDEAVELDDFRFTSSQYASSEDSRPECCLSSSHGGSMESILSSFSSGVQDCSSNCDSTSSSSLYSSSESSSQESSQSSTSTRSSTSSNASTVKTSPWRKVRSLVTSPFIQTYKRQKYPWIQLAGHQGNFLAGQMQGTILKKKSGNEDKCFQALMEDDLRDFVPQFKNLVYMNNESYIELEDLLANFTNPSIMDIKMGVRTYLEEELIKAGEKPKLRKDMYEKMVAIDPNEPKAHEHAQRAVTKPRYMVWRESISSSSTLGFRIDGVKLRSGTDNCRTMKDFKRTKTEDSVAASILQFSDNNRECIDKYLAKLQLIRKTLQVSEFFRTHEVIGSSLLLVHDDTHADIWLIDFAKTCPLPENVRVNHRDTWELGNHEDGYLTGLDNLIRIFSNLTCDRVKDVKH